jgi:hypothetical protein
MISFLLAACFFSGSSSHNYDESWTFVVVVVGAFSSLSLLTSHLIFIFRSFKNENMHTRRETCEWEENRHQRQFNLWHIYKGLKATFAAFMLWITLQRLKEESLEMKLWRSINTQQSRREMMVNGTITVCFDGENPFFFQERLIFHLTDELLNAVNATEFNVLSRCFEKSLFTLLHLTTSPS